MTCEVRGPKTPDHAAVCDPAVRNRYFRGKLLTVADYQAEQRYLIQRRRMVNRVVLGLGVISGFNVEVDKNNKLGISDGVAFDRRGREVVACGPVTLDSEDDIVWLTKNDPPEKIDGKPANGKYLLSAHYAECLVDGVRIEEGCGQCSDEWNHVRETVVYSLRPVDECPRGRPGCHKPHWDASNCVPVHDPKQKPEDTAGGVVRVAGADDRGPHETLCEWSGDRLKGKDSFDPCATYELCSGDCIRFDPAAGVPLACVEVYIDERRPVPGIDGCRYVAFSKRERECDARRLVHPNDTLYDLLRGCDLTRIQSIGWIHLEESGMMSRKHFAELFWPTEQQKDMNYEKNEPVDTGFSICFTGPVQIASLTSDVIAMTLVQLESRERLGEVRRVPIDALWIAPKQGDDLDGTTRGFRPMVNWRFWAGEIPRSMQSGFEHRTLVEIEVRGDFILDLRGQTVDANRFGRRFPTGNGTPGGTFLWTFTVTDEPRPRVQTGVDPRTL